MNARQIRDAIRRFFEKTPECMLVNDVTPEDVADALHDYFTSIAPKRLPGMEGYADMEYDGVAERETELESLKREMDKYEGVITDLRKAHEQCIADADAQIRPREERILALQQEVDECVRSRDELISTRDELLSTTQQQVNQIAALNEASKSASDLIGAANQKITQLETDLSTQKAEITRLNDIVLEKDTEISATNTKNVAQSSQIAELKESIGTQAENITRLTSILQQKDKTIEQLNAGASAASAEIATSQQAMVAKDQEIDRLGRELTSMTQKLKEQVADMDRLTELAAGLRDQLASREAIIEELSQTNTTTSEETTRLQSQVASMMTEITDKAMIVTQLQQKLSDADDRLAAMVRERDNMARDNDVLEMRLKNAETAVAEDKSNLSIVMQRLDNLIRRTAL